MKKIISVITATRAEYGLLYPLIVELKKNEDFDVRLVVTGAHLSPFQGNTNKQIENDGVEIDEKISILMASDDEASISKTMGVAMMSFADYFKNLKPDMAVILGDRYEMLSIAIAAFNANIKIAHIHGGEKTAGAKDDSIRHAITKISDIHFASTEQYRKRIIQLGENPNTVFNVGSLGVENIKKIKLFDKKENAKNLKISEDENYALATYHPVTTEINEAKNQIETLINAISKIKDTKFIFTKANADTGGNLINEMLEEAVKKYENILLYDSLGTKGYLSAVKYSRFVIGNSSSAIIEVPSLKVPTINIGTRQAGRTRAVTVIDIDMDEKEIIKAIDKAKSEEFLAFKKDLKNPYEKDGTSENISKKIAEFLEEDKTHIKEFNDIDF